MLKNIHEIILFSEIKQLNQLNIITFLGLFKSKKKKIKFSNIEENIFDKAQSISLLLFLELLYCSNFSSTKFNHFSISGFSVKFVLLAIFFSIISTDSPSSILFENSYNLILSEEFINLLIPSERFLSIFMFSSLFSLLFIIID